jgi:ribosome biogenesis GTPase
MKGTVLQRDGSVYRVATPEGEVQAVLRGKTKRGGPKVVVGDVVHLEREPVGDLFAIQGLDERRSLLARRVPEGRGQRPIVANVDQVVVVTATRDPKPILQLVDRLLVIAASQDLPAILTVNKIDLEPGIDLVTRYRQIGYDVLGTSAESGEGIAEFGACVADRTSVVTGPSGVGKSSLLNALQPGLKLRVGDVSPRVGRGRHTTVSSIMVPLSSGGFLVDTPGFSEVGLWGLPLGELAGAFPDFEAFTNACRYADCLHDREPACAIRTAADQHEISPERYRSYLTLLGELQRAPKAWE